MSCTCHSCGRQYRVDFMVSDELWREIGPVTRRAVYGGLMCGVCIAEAIEARGEYGAYQLTDLVSTDIAKEPSNG